VSSLKTNVVTTVGDELPAATPPQQDDEQDDRCQTALHHLHVTCLRSCDLFAHGGRTDSEGWSWSDCLRRIDEGAVDAAGNPMPGVPPLPAGAGAPARAAQSARRSRLKESHTYMMPYIGNPDLL